MADDSLMFQRANFFPGLIATPKFWNDMQGYLFQKEQFYNRIFNGCGIIPDLSESLRVEPLAKGGGVITLVVHPGVAIDGFGRPVFLSEPKAIVLDYRKFKLPCTVFVTINYDEEFMEYFQNQEHPDLQGYQKKTETAKIDINSSVHDPRTQIELARIFLQEDANSELREIRNAANFADPGPNALDLRFVPWLSAARKSMSPYLKDFFVSLLDATRNVAASAYDNVPLPSFRELQTVSMTAKMLVQCGEVAFGDLIHILFPLFDVNSQILQEMLDYERDQEKRFFTVRIEFEAVKQAVYRMGDQIKYFEQKYEELDAILKCQREVVEGLKSMVVSKQVTIESIALMSQELPRILLVEDDRYTLVDFIDMGNKEALEAHQMEFKDNKDVSTSNQSATYPDGVIVRDTLKRYVGGKVFFKLMNLVKRRRLLIIRRTDIYHGNYEIEVSLNGVGGRSMLVDGSDTKDRWRNLTVRFNEEEIEDNSALLEFAIGDKGRDNLGRVWVYQLL